MFIAGEGGLRAHRPLGIEGIFCQDSWIPFLFLVLVLRQVLAPKPRLALNSRPSCLCLSNVAFTGASHATWLDQAL